MNFKINTPEQALAIARAQVGRGIYQLGTGTAADHPDDPTDCAGFAFCRCYGFPRHWPGFNNIPQASVSDDLNCNSAIENAEYPTSQPRAFQLVWDPVAQKVHDDIKPGDLITYPTFYVKGKPQPWIGHVAIISAVPADWHWPMSRFRDLRIIQCVGPNGRRPGIIEAGGAHFDLHDSQWPQLERQTRIIRPIGDHAAS